MNVISAAEVRQNGVRQIGEMRLFEREAPSVKLDGRAKWSTGYGDERIELTGVWKVLHTDNTVVDSILLPFCWEGVSDQLVLEKRFKLPRRMWDKRFRLVVDEFAQNLAITLNGYHLATQSGDGVSFQIDISPGVLRYGVAENELVLTIDNRLGHRSEAPLKGGIYARRRYGGIFSDLYLMASPQVAITELTAKWRNANAEHDTVAVQTEFRRQENTENQSDSIQYQYKISVIDNNGAIVGGTSEHLLMFSQNNIARISVDLPISITPQPYDQVNNSSYQVLCELITDKVVHSSVQFLKKSAINFSSSRFMVNGEAKQLRCVSYFESNPETGVIISAEQVRKDIALIKELGVDVVRVMQGPASLNFLDLCERNGIHVFQELPVFQAPDEVLVEPEFITSAKGQLKAMINRDQSFSCIIGWGIGSEINPPNRDNIAYYKELVGFVHSLDERPVYASVPFDDKIQAAPLDFIILELTSYSGWNQLPLPNKINSDRPLFLGGIRQLVIPGNLGGWADHASEAGQTHYLIKRLQQAKDLNWCKGVIIGDLSDWAGAVSTVTMPFRSDLNLYTAGLANHSRQPRLAFRTLSEYWASGTIQPLQRGTAQKEDKGTFVIIGICLVVILFVLIRQNHLFKLNLVRTFSSPRIFFQEIGEKRYFQSGSTILVAMLIAGGTALVFTSCLSAYRHSYQLDWIVGYLFGDTIVHQWLANWTWQPTRSLVVVWGLFFVLIWVGAIRATIMSRLMGRPFSLVQGFYFVSWSLVSCIALLPVGVVAHRLYLHGNGWVVTWVTIVVLAWSHFRLWKVLHQILKQPIGKIFVFWMIGPIIVLIIMVLYLESSHSLSYYWNYFWGTIVS